MTENKTKKESELLFAYIIKAIQEKKGKNIINLNLKKIENSVCDNFIICHGTSKTHVEAIADSVEEFVKKNTGVIPWHKEGYENAEWILIDYFDIVVHIFSEDTRKFYNLESLWADADTTIIEE